jgi:hypothetical protein
MADLSWYAAKENSSVYHFGVEVAPGKKILLDKQQADLHSTTHIESCDPPKKSNECAVLSEFQEWALLNPVVEKTSETSRTSRAPEEASGDVSSRKSK